MDVEEGTVALVDHPDEIWGRCTFNDLEGWMKFKPLKRVADLASDVGSRYAANDVKIKYAKYKDLMEKVVDKGVLPEEYVLFYRELPHDGPVLPAARRVQGEEDESDYDSDGDDYIY
jgi:hypothetical protein